MGRKLAHNLFIKDGFLIYDKANGVDRYVVPLAGIDTVVLYQPMPDIGVLRVLAGGDEVFRAEYDVATAARLQRIVLKLLDPDTTQTSLGL